MAKLLFSHTMLVVAGFVGAPLYWQEIFAKNPRSMRLARRRSHLALAVVYIFSGLAVSAAEPQKPSEYQVKAAYLYNFGKFVNWNAKTFKDPSRNFQICVLGQDPFGSVLDSAVAGETISGKPVRVRRLGKPEEGSECEVVFISASEQSRLKQILMEVPQTEVLTVSDIPDFMERGGMIQFITRDNRVRFEVNVGAAEHAGLNLSSELLKVAVAVRGNREPEK